MSRCGLPYKPAFPISSEPVPGALFGNEQGLRVFRQYETTRYVFRRRISRTRNGSLYGRLFCRRLYGLQILRGLYDNPVRNLDRLESIKTTYGHYLFYG